MLENFRRDIRHSARLFSRSPGLVATACLTLAVGAGSNTALFSLAKGVLLRPLPLPEPDELVSLTETLPKGAFVEYERSAQMTKVAAYWESELNVARHDRPVRVAGTAVSADFFGVLGVRAAMGRTFQRGEDRPGADGVVMLSDAFWRNEFAARRDVIGEMIRVDGVDRQIVGVLPPEFALPSTKTRIWVPLSLNPMNVGDYWGGSYMPVVGRLRGGASLEQARAELRRLVPAIRDACPWAMPDNWKAGIGMVALQRALAGDTRGRLLALLAATGFILLIACANVASLLSAMAATRQKEFAIRAALGAERGHVVRQLLTEGLMLAAAGVALGLVLARPTVALFERPLPAGTVGLDSTSVDGEVMLLTSLVVVLCAVTFGAVPTLAFAKVDPAQAFQSTFHQSPPRATTRVRSALVIFEVAVSVVLVVAGTLLLRSLWRMMEVPLGFEEERRVAVRITPDETLCEAPGRCEHFYRGLLAGVAARPGIEAAAVVDGLPLEGGMQPVPVGVEGHVVQKGHDPPVFWQRAITVDYLKVMGIRLLRGRTFTPEDYLDNAAPVVLVSATTARRYWPGQDPLGRMVSPIWAPMQPRAIVGVVADVQEHGIFESDVLDWYDGQFYVPYGARVIRADGSEGPVPEMTLVVKSPRRPDEIVAAAAEVIPTLGLDVPLPREARTLSAVVRSSLAVPRSSASLFTCFALLALLLQAIGIYGIVSYSTARRSRELGIRIVLGAEPREVTWLVVRQGLRLAVAGVGLGLIAAVAVGRLMVTLLYGTSTADPAALAAGSVGLLVLAALASYVPARQLMRTSPETALRRE